MNMIERTQEVMLQLELSNVKQMLDIMRGSIAKKCFNCEENVTEAVINCRASEERGKEIQNSLCIKCGLHEYKLEREGEQL